MPMNNIQKCAECGEMVESYVMVEQCISKRTGQTLEIFFLCYECDAKIHAKK
jgi:hypothetical protein